MSFPAFRLEQLDFDRGGGGGGGLITVVTQDAVTGAVLMVAHMDCDALKHTLDTGEMHYRSRTRGPWRKGETSGNVQRWLSLSADCDGDTLLARVRPAGPACHTGAVTCFEGPTGDTLSDLAAVIAARAASAAPSDETQASYTRRLLADRNLRLKKITEEGGEFAVACADGDRVQVGEEAADLLYHVLVALQAAGVTLDDVRAILHERHERSRS